MFSVELTLSDSNGETYKVTDSTSDRWTPVWFYSTSGKLKCQDHDYQRCPHVLAVIKEKGEPMKSSTAPKVGRSKQEC
jgi:hypothetical protein